VRDRDQLGAEKQGDWLAERARSKLINIYRYPMLYNPPLFAYNYSLASDLKRREREREIERKRNKREKKRKRNKRKRKRKRERKRRR
jgi:hypothetical protein